MTTEYIIHGRVQICSFDESDGEVVSEMSPQPPTSHPGDQRRPPASSVTGGDIQQPPDGVDEAEDVVVGEEDVVDEKTETSWSKDDEDHQVGGDCGHLTETVPS